MSTIKTTVLTREVIDEIINNRNINFLIGINNNGEIERFVPEDCGCDGDMVEHPIPAEQIEDMQQFEVKTFTVKPQETRAAAATCIKYCSIGGYTWCCKFA